MTAPLPPLVAPSKPIDRGVSSVGSQRDRRFTDTFFDTYRHARFPSGRPFTGQREFQSGSSTESIAAGFAQSDLQLGEYFCERPDLGQTPEERQMTLASAWHAPWLMPGGKKYMAFDYRRKRITFRYDAYIGDERKGLARFWEAAAKLAGESDIIDPARPDAVPFRIRTLLGSPRLYMNNIRLVEACMAGDPWIMGAVDTPNEELARLLGLNVQYLGPRHSHGDAEYVAVEKPAAPAAPLTPDQVLATAGPELQAVIAAAIAQHEAQKKAVAGARIAKAMAKARAARKPKTASVVA